MDHTGRFFTFKSVDGCGKSRQLERLAQRLEAAGRTVVRAQEPGGTRVGREIRQILLDARSVNLRATPELLLYFASRAQNVEEVILPALEAGHIVPANRFTDSSTAYQGCGRGLGVDVVATLDRIACRGLRPDLTFPTDLDPETGLRRADPTRFELESLELHRRVRDGYLEIHRREPDRVLLIDGRRTPDEIAQDIWSRAPPYVGLLPRKRLTHRRPPADARRKPSPPDPAVRRPRRRGQGDPDPSPRRRFQLCAQQLRRMLHLPPHPADDLSLQRKLFEERAKASPDKRKDNPLVISSFPEFLTFSPDGPLAQISIDQVRKLKDYAVFGPSHGHRRLFLIDSADRRDAAANSLLKILEEPPPYLTLILTATNAFDLLPTIRSRAVPFYFAPLSREEMDRFLASRPDIPASDRPRLLAWAQGSPGCAISIDIEAYGRRRRAMLALLSGSFPDLLPHTEAIGRSKNEKLDLQLDALYSLLRDLLCLQHGAGHSSTRTAGPSSPPSPLASTSRGAKGPSPKSTASATWFAATSRSRSPWKPWPSPWPVSPQKVEHRLNTDT